MMELLKVSDSLTGKMEGMTVITSSMTNNANCQKLAQCEGSICQHCYSKTAMSYRKNMQQCYERNGRILSESIIPKNQLPFINSLYCRFESHGDLHNEIHLENFINIAKKNPHCQFALWTKQYDIILHYFKTHKQPKNFNIVLSSLMLNIPIDTTPFEALGLKVKTFTVWDKETSKSVNINCGKKNCIDCLICYKKNSKVTAVNETIK